MTVYLSISFSYLFCELQSKLVLNVFWKIYICDIFVFIFLFTKLRHFVLSFALTRADKPIRFRQAHDHSHRDVDDRWHVEIPDHRQGDRMRRRRRDTDRSGWLEEALDNCVHSIQPYQVSAVFLHRSWALHNTLRLNSLEKIANPPLIFTRHAFIWNTSWRLLSPQHRLVQAPVNTTPSPVSRLEPATPRSTLTALTNRANAGTRNLW